MESASQIVDAVADLGIWSILGWIIAGGAIGGIIDLAFKLNIEEITKEGTNEKSPIVCFAYNGVCIGFESFLVLLAVNGLIGVGGAIGVQFIIIGIQKFSSAATIENLLLVLSISLVAGFSARRLLPQISNKMARDLDVAKKKTEEIEKTIEKTEKKTADIDVTTKQTRMIAEEAERIAKETDKEREEGDEETFRELQALRPDATRFARQWAIEHFTKATTSDPTNRESAIKLGRLYKFNKDYLKGIETLTRFLDVKGDEEDVDFADVLYNRACYKSLLWEQNKKKPATLRDEALEDLTKSISINPENKEEAKEDKDFNPIKSSKAFRKLTK